MNVTLFMFSTIFFLPSAIRLFTFSRSALLSSPSTMRPSSATTDTPSTSRFVILSAMFSSPRRSRFQPLGANGTILRSIFLWGNRPRLRRELRRCVLRRLRPNRRRPWLHGLFHGGDGYSTSPCKGKAPVAQVPCLHPESGTCASNRLIGNYHVPSRSLKPMSYSAHLSSRARDRGSKSNTELQRCKEVR